MAKTVANEIFKYQLEINGDQAKKELQELEKATRDLNDENKALRNEKFKLKAQNKQNSKEYKQLTARIKANKIAMDENNSRMKVLRKEIGITGLTMNQLSKEASKLKLQLRNMTPGSSQYKELESRLQAVDSRMRQLRGSARATESSLSRWANGFNKYAALGAGLIATLTGVVFKLQQVVDFNGKMSESQADVMKTTGMTKDEVDDLTKSFGLLQTRTNRINLLNIAEQGGRIGIAKEDISEFVEIMNKAVVALGDEFPGGASETARSLGTLKGLFAETRDLGVDEAYNSIGSAINELGANGLASAPNLANFTKRVGAMPEALRPSIAQALGLGAALEESGLEAEQSSRAYSIFMTTASKDVEKFADVMGLGVDEVKEMINTNPTKFFLDFAQGIDGMDATDTAQTLNYLGLSADGVKKILGAAASNTQLFRDKMILANDAMQEGTSLVDEYNIKNNNFQATLDKIGKKIRGAFSSETVVSNLEAIVNWFAKFIGAVNDASGSTQRWRQFLLFLIKMIAIATTAVYSYTAAQKLYDLWTRRSIAATKLHIVVTKAYNLAMRLGAAATLLGKAAFFALTGNIKRATAVMRIFNTVTKLNPWLLLASAVAAVGVAYIAFRENAKAAKTEQELLNDTLKEAEVKTASQRAKVLALDKVVRDETKSEKERKKAIEKLNKIVPNYNRDLDLGKSALERSKIALDQYIDSLKRQAQAQALANLMSAKAEELEKAKQAGNTENLAWYESAFYWMMSARTGIGGIDEVKGAQKNKEIVKKLQEEFDAISKLYAENDFKQAQTKTPLELEIEKLERNRSMVDKNSKAYERLTEKIKKLKKQFKAVDPNNNNDGGASTSTDYLTELRNQRFAAAEERARLIKDEFERERALEEINHAKRLEDLRSQLIDTSKLKGDAKRQAEQINDSINQRIELENKAHQERLATIEAGGIASRLEDQKSAHDRAVQQLKIRHTKELAAFTGNDQQKKALQKRHQQEELELQERHANAALDLIKSIFENGEFKGLDLSLLDEGSLEQFYKQVEQVKQKLAEIGLAKSNLTDNSTDQKSTAGAFGNGAADSVDFLGFSVAQWQQMFANLDTTQDKLAAVSMGLSALTDIYSSYSNLLNAQENNDLQAFTQRQERKRESLDKRLDRGYINQRQYNKAVEKMELERERYEAELRYKQAKREKIATMAGIVSNGSLAISKAIAASPLTTGMPWTAIIAGQTALQLGLAAATPLPAKGYEDGLYPMMREQDGKIFNVQYGGEPTTQLVSKPTHFIAGETQPEMIIDGTTFSGFTPQFRQSLYREIGRVKGYENGYYQNDTGVPQFSSERLESLLELNSSFLQLLLSNGVTAYMSKDMRNTQRLQEELDRYNKLRKNNRA